MKTIHFDAAVYNLVDDINVNSVRFQATIYKGDTTVDSIAEAVNSAEKISVYNDQELVGLYFGYNKPIAFSLGYLDDGTAIVSIELDNTDISTQVDAIQSKVDTHDDEIASIDAGVADLAGEVAELEETQLSQDAAIEDLAEGMAEMTEV